LAKERKRIICIGEAMLELSRSGDDWRMGYGGDTLNTAIHLARAGHDVAYLTALGTDPLSAGLREKWAAEGLDTSLVLNHPTRSTGLYAISTDAAGERSFSYWRDTSAARQMFALPGMAEALAAAEQADLIVYSLITLAILPPEAREALFALCQRVRALGGRVAFDGNYRPRLWASAEEARAARDAAIACTDIGLPTLEDELLMERDADDHNRRPALDAGLGCATQPSESLAPFDAACGVAQDRPSQARGDVGELEAVAHHWTTLGCAETIVKLGADGARLPDGTTFPPPEVLNPVDTSGAGDAFNGGYLAARMNGAIVADAVMAGHRLAGWCVMRSGAIPARD
jgi:2-dehydro-3-deoxygluconokinase